MSIPNWKESFFQIFRKIPPLNLSSALSHTILVAGTGRSGTTWLAQILNHNNSFRQIFEPFHPDNVAKADQVLGRKKFLPPQTRTTEPHTFIQDVLQGKISTPWTNRINKKLLSSRRLVKTIHGNLLLGYIHQQFPEVKQVLIIRHPLAVAYSKQKTGWWVTPEIDTLFLNQHTLVQQHLAPIQDKLSGLESSLDKIIAAWCIENFIALQTVSAGGAYLVFYEDLVHQPQKTIPQLFAHLNLPFTPDILEKAQIPSYTTRADSAVMKHKNMLTEWQGHFSSSDCDRMEEMLGWFGLDALYTRDPFPEVSSEKAGKVVPQLNVKPPIEHL